MNEWRAHTAEGALKAFMIITGQTEQEEAMRDLITNLRHLADRIEMPEHVRKYLLYHAEKQYDAETTE